MLYYPPLAPLLNLPGAPGSEVSRRPIDSEGAEGAERGSPALGALREQKTHPVRVGLVFL